jgi:predicted nuclease with TOPRIM domain
LEALKASYAQLQTDIADLKVKLTEAEINFKAVSDIRTTVETELATVKAELKVFKDKELAEAEKTKAEDAKKKFESRLGEVPEVVKENLNKHANKELVLARWKDADDEAWAVITQGFALAFTAAPTYLSRSREEGRMPVVSDKDKDQNNLKTFLRD